MPHSGLWLRKTLAYTLGFEADAVVRETLFSVVVSTSGLVAGYQVRRVCHNDTFVFLGSVCSFHVIP